MMGSYKLSLAVDLASDFSLTLLSQHFGAHLLFPFFLSTYFAWLYSPLPAFVHEMVTFFYGTVLAQTLYRVYDNFPIFVGYSTPYLTRRVAIYTVLGSGYFAYCLLTLNTPLSLCVFVLLNWALLNAPSDIMSGNKMSDLAVNYLFEMARFGGLMFACQNRIPVDALLLMALPEVFIHLSETSPSQREQIKLPSVFVLCYYSFFFLYYGPSLLFLFDFALVRTRKIFYASLLTSPLIKEIKKRLVEHLVSHLSTDHIRSETSYYIVSASYQIDQFLRRVPFLLTFVRELRVRDIDLYALLVLVNKASVRAPRFSADEIAFYREKRQAMGDQNEDDFLTILTAKKVLGITLTVVFMVILYLFDEDPLVETLNTLNEEVSDEEIERRFLERARTSHALFTLYGSAFVPRPFRGITERYQKALYNFRVTGFNAFNRFADIASDSHEPHTTFSVLEARVIYILLSLKYTDQLAFMFQMPPGFGGLDGTDGEDQDQTNETEEEREDRLGAQFDTFLTQIPNVLASLHDLPTNHDTENATNIEVPVSSMTEESSTSSQGVTASAEGTNAPTEGDRARHAEILNRVLTDLNTRVKEHNDPRPLQQEIDRNLEEMLSSYIDAPNR